MAVRGAAVRRNNLLPAAAREALRRRGGEALGGLLLLSAFLLALALAGFNAADPSLNNATQQRAANWLGLPGALVADLMLQGCGLASLLLVAAFITWGVRLATHRGGVRFALALPLLPLALALAAAALAFLPAPAAWPLDAGLGGFAGDLARRGAEALAGALAVPAAAAAAIIALAALAAGLPALGLARGDWHGLGRGLWRAVAALRPVLAFVLDLEHRLRGRRFAAGPRAPQARTEPRLVPRPSPKRARAEAPAPASAAAPVAEEPVPALVEPAPQRLRAGKRAETQRQGTLDLETDGDYQLPSLDLLDMPPKAAGTQLNEEALAQNARLLESVLEDFGVRGEIIKVRPGPVVTLYELEPAPGIKSSRVIGLADDIARSMSAVSARVAVVPGRNVIGIELPNPMREIVHLRELMESEAYESTAAKLTLVLGKDIAGAPVIVDLATMPHLLVAGTTGSGKSVAINTMILSLIYRLPPEQCRFIMIDPKMLELSIYDDIPHLLAPVVTDPGKAVVALKWTVREMENRYRLMSNLGVRNVAGYNKRIEQALEKGEVLTRQVQTGFDPETGQPIQEEQPLSMEPLPYIVVIVDEMADLMMVAGKDIEWAIQRLAQMARAAGIHIIMATQRPSVDVITGTIKANFPTRISFQVTSKIDSRTILGEQGAEQLLGMGDMLYMARGGRVTRVHGPFVSDEEVERVTDALRRQGDPDYRMEVVESEDDGDLPGLGQSGADSGDALYDQAVALVCRERKASTSFIQRHLQIGYNRAARIVERMEKEGVVGAANHVGKREVLARDIDDGRY